MALMHWRAYTGEMYRCLTGNEPRHPRHNMNGIGLHFGGSDDFGWRRNLRVAAAANGVNVDNLSTIGVVMQWAESVTGVQATSWGHAWELLATFYCGGVILVPSEFLAMIQGEQHFAMIENSQFIGRAML